MKVPVVIFDCIYDKQYVLKSDSIKSIDKYYSNGLIGKNINDDSIIVFIPATSIIAVTFKEIENLNNKTNI